MIAMVLKLGLNSGDSGEILRLAKVKTEEVMSAYKIVREAIDSPGPIAAGSDISQHRYQANQSSYQTSLKDNAIC